MIVGICEKCQQDIHDRDVRHLRELLGLPLAIDPANDVRVHIVGKGHCPGPIAFWGAHKPRERPSLTIYDTSRYEPSRSY